jgi:hypothetical protein
MTYSAIDPAVLREHLEMAERHVTEGERHIMRQCELIAALKRDGHDMTTARELLAQFEEMQALHIADRDRLRQELAAAQPDE